ncbi:MAG: hypothetical protein RLY41_83 [Pseudomonadota bacterium]
MRFSFSLFVAFTCVLTGLASTPAFASDPPKKAAKEEPPKPKIEYVEEEGELGRGGYIYKRVAKPKFEVPQEVPKAEPKEPPKPPEKDDHGKPDPKAKKDDGHGDPKKEEKKKDDGHGDPKKDAKKGGDAHGGGHGDAHGKDKKKPAPPAISVVYDSAIIKLDGNNRPFTPVVFSNTYADYFVCHKTVKTKYRETVLAEMNTFADRMGIPRAQDMPCMVKIAKPNTRFPGAIYIEFYVDTAAEKACIKKGQCGATRLMMLHPKDKTGIKSKEIYRSYVLTDEKKFRRANFCVSPDGQMLGEKNCYVALNPDWLFN